MNFMHGIASLMSFNCLNVQKCLLFLCFELFICISASLVNIEYQSHTYLVPASPDFINWLVCNLLLKST
jgi:hypothetical protein